MLFRWPSLYWLGNHDVPYVHRVYCPFHKYRVGNQWKDLFLNFFINIQFLNNIDNNVMGSTILLIYDFGRLLSQIRCIQGAHIIGWMHHVPVGMNLPCIMSWRYHSLG